MNPKLKCKYAKGLGDIIACVLHSKLLGWFTHFLTGKKEPCTMCSNRSNALNVLFPFCFWRLFFKDYKQYLDVLYQELKDYGYDVEMSEKDNALIIHEHEVSQKQIQVREKKIKKEPKLVSTSKTELEGYLIKTEIYKY
jgi:hypothetical protein